jgi:hypothetical protein
MTRTRVSLTVLNLDTATFECTYGRGCEGICCQNGRPPVSTEESARIEKNLPKFMPHLTPQARQLIQQHGFVSRRMKSGKPMLRVVGGWCVFFHQGCVLHKVGAAEGDKFKYKPAPCALFPLERDDASGHLYVRQHGYKGEQWDLFCLDPGNTSIKAAESLAEELAYAKRLVSE